MATGAPVVSRFSVPVFMTTWTELYWSEAGSVKVRSPTGSDMASLEPVSVTLGGTEFLATIPSMLYVSALWFEYSSEMVPVEAVMATEREEEVAFIGEVIEIGIE